MFVLSDMILKILEKLELKIKEFKCDRKDKETAKSTKNAEKKLKKNMEFKLENQRKEIEEKNFKITS